MNGVKATSQWESCSNGQEEVDEVTIVHKHRPAYQKGVLGDRRQANIMGKSSTGEKAFWIFVSRCH